MMCQYCGKEMEIKEMQNYKYEESGLTNVYLRESEVYYCVSCQFKLLKLDNVLELHKTIARAIVLEPVLLNGDDIKFLRSERGLTIEELAELLKVDLTIVSQWETNSQELSLESDALIRKTYILVYQEQEREKFPRVVTENIVSVREKRDANFLISIILVWN